MEEENGTTNKKLTDEELNILKFLKTYFTVNANANNNEPQSEEDFVNSITKWADIIIAKTDKGDFNFNEEESSQLKNLLSLGGALYNALVTTKMKQDQEKRRIRDEIQSNNLKIFFLKSVNDTLTAMKFYIPVFLYFLIGAFSTLAIELIKNSISIKKKCFLQFTFFKDECFSVITVL